MWEFLMKFAYERYSSQKSSSIELDEKVKFIKIPLKSKKAFLENKKINFIQFLCLDKPLSQISYKWQFYIEY